jgi:acyl-CoA thioesterase
LSSVHAFDRALVLEKSGDGRLSGATVPEYGNFTGQFGGITAATLLKAALDEDRAEGAPVSLTVNYTAGVKPGAFDIAVRAIRLGRTLQHWGLDMMQGDVVVATALVTLGQRGESWAHAPLTAPAAPPPETVAPLDSSQWRGWTTQYDFRFIAGSTAHLRDKPPLETPGDARSLLWLRHVEPRPLDFPGLACMSDAFFVRMIQVRNTFPAMGTVSLTTQFHADAALLAAQGDRALLCAVDSRAFRTHFHDQSADLWSADGALLATSHQMVWYAE